MYDWRGGTGFPWGTMKSRAVDGIEMVMRMGRTGEGSGRRGKKPYEETTGRLRLRPSTYEIRLAVVLLRWVLVSIVIVGETERTGAKVDVWRGYENEWKSEEGWEWNGTQQGKDKQVGTCAGRDGRKWRDAWELHISSKDAGVGW
ncbi:hypothetical protein C8J57DRAFT_1475443 [Mycena rebaudengoi]|nr:hypothetical protein C8J57DRAFT_1475443 [Mycena rebaudengoi]